jgi:hypothetical protein
MVSGKCIVWSWVNSVAIALWVLLFVVASALSYDNQMELASGNDYIYIREAEKIELST